MQTIFITGTDTNVGKTYVACRLLEQWRAEGLRVAALKPVASGAIHINGRLCNDDAMQLQQAAGAWQELAAINPFCFEPAIAPHLAAAEAGALLTVASVQYALLPTLQRTDIDRVLIEGAGGWLVPLNETETFGDLAGAVADGVVLVVALRLGCINHALLTVAAIRQSGLPLLGWVANEVEPMVCAEQNIATLIARIDAPCLGKMAHAALTLTSNALIASQSENQSTPYHPQPSSERRGAIRR